MPTRCFVTFPATGVKAGMDNVLHSISEFIIGKFPQRTIRAINVDTKDKMRDFYKSALQGYAGKVNENLEGIQELVKIPKPHLFVGYTMDSGFDTTDTGMGEMPTWAYPSAHYLDENLSSAFPVLLDKDRGDIQISTYNLRVRVTAEFLFNCNSKEEQISLYVYIKNFIRDLYMHAVPNIKTRYVIPNSLIDALKDRLYGEGVPYANIGDSMDEYLKKYSNGGIVPVYKNNDENSKYYVMKYDYKQVDFKLSGKPQIDDGEKKEMAYDNYTIRFPAMVEFYVPTTYVLRTPKLVIGSGGVYSTPDFIKMDEHIDKNCNVPIIPIVKSYHDLAKRMYIDSNKFFLIARDEFALSDSEDYYDIRWAMRDNDIKIFDALTDDQRKECYKILLFENDVLLDKGKYFDIDKDWICKIHDGDITKSQMIEIYLDIETAKYYIENNKRLNHGNK